jgi:hypothetical protein
MASVHLLGKAEHYRRIVSTVSDLFGEYKRAILLLGTGWVRALCV